MVILSLRMLMILSTTLIVLTTIANGGTYREVDDQEVKNLVQEGIDLIQDKGDLAFSIISKRNGRFNRDNLLLYVYDDEVTLCAHPTVKSRIGSNLKGTKDVEGNMFRDEIVEKGLRGGGWSTYVYKDHVGHGLHFKRVYSDSLDHNGKKYIVAAETLVHEKTDIFLSEQEKHSDKDISDDKHHH
ncbi:MAG: cache domain-containing protein [Nitrospiraceae bacterium]|nr:MAG: cache domain-containing protein [Nitrospiraceae bacterium]